MKAKSALSLALAAGIASTAVASNTPTTLSPNNTTVNKVAHIYFNIASGERVVTLLGDGQTAPADTGLGGPVWSALVNNTCESAGFSTNFFFGVDDNSGTTSLSTAVTNLDFADIEANTVVDCIHINWVTDHDDVDADSDGLGDGVVGLAGQWTIWDADNGREADRSTRTELISFIFTDLPGDTDPSPDFLAGYTADIDLVASFTGTDLSFEIGDDDSDPQEAAIHNAGIGLLDNNFDGLPDSDLDGDGLFDWSWGVRFFQPGTEDFDSDGTPDGDPADGFKTIGITFGSPAGVATDDGAGGWTWDIETSEHDSGTGVEDAFALFAPPDLNGDIIHAGFFWFGGFACVDTPNPGDGYNPPAQFEFQMFGPSGTPGDTSCSPADLNDDGVLNFFDVSLFLADFGMGGDYNGDGTVNFFDVSFFLADFNNGGTCL